MRACVIEPTINNQSQLIYQPLLVARYARECPSLATLANASWVLVDGSATGGAFLRGPLRGAPRHAPVVSRSPFRGVAVQTAPPLSSERSTTSALGEPTRHGPLVLTAPLRLAVGSGARYARECSLGAR